MSFFGVGALLSPAGGWRGDRCSPRIVLSGTFLSTSALGYLFFQWLQSAPMHAILVFVYSVVSAILYMNLAGYQVKAARSSLSSRVSGPFVTSVYWANAFAGYLMGWLAPQGGWALAGGVQISLLSIVAAVLALALRPREMRL